MRKNSDFRRKFKFEKIPKNQEEIWENLRKFWFEKIWNERVLFRQYDLKKSDVTKTPFNEFFIVGVVAIPPYNILHFVTTRDK